MKKVNMFSIDILGVTSGDLENYIREKLLGNCKVKIGKINTEFLYRVQKNTSFKNTLNNFDLNIADGRGVLWAARYLTLPLTKLPVLKQIQAIWQMIYSGAAIVLYPKFIANPIPENIPGVDALILMLNVVKETKFGVFFFGATQNDLEAAQENIKEQIPDIKIFGSLNGYDWQKDNNIDPVKVINNTDAKLLIVALGSPLQEFWIRDNLDKLDNIKIAVGEGGSLAFLAGTLKRAPNWMKKLGIEWLWRLFTNKSLTHQTGSRLKRVWNAVPVFIYEIVKYKIKDN